MADSSELDERVGAWKALLPSRGLRSRGLAFHTPGSFKARAAVRIAQGLSLLGIKAHLAKRTVGLYARTQAALQQGSLTEWLSGQLGYRIVDLVIYAGSESPRRKITALGIAQRGNPDVVIKIADTDAGTEAIAQETQALQALVASDLAAQVPRLLLEADWNGYRIQVQGALPHGGSRQESRLTDSHLAFLSSLSRIGRRTMPLRQTRMWQHVKAWAKTTPTEAMPDAIRALMHRILSDACGDVCIVCHRTHGDFAPWNVTTHRGKLFVYDWEDSLPDGLALTDAFHFLFRQASLVGPWPGARALAGAMADVARRVSHLSGAVCHDGIASAAWCLTEGISNPSPRLAELAAELTSLTHE